MSIMIDRANTYQDLQSSSPTITKAIDTETSYTCFTNPDWNGCLVVYTQTSTQPPMPDSFRQDLLSRGFAVAIARYTDNVALGQDKDYHLQKIQGFFARRCGTPHHVHEIGGGFTLLPPIMGK